MRLNAEDLEIISYALDIYEVEVASLGSNDEDMPTWRKAALEAVDKVKTKVYAEILKREKKTAK